MLAVRPLGRIKVALKIKTETIKQKPEQPGLRRKI